MDSGKICKEPIRNQSCKEPEAQREVDGWCWWAEAGASRKGMEMERWETRVKERGVTGAPFWGGEGTHLSEVICCIGSSSYLRCCCVCSIPLVSGWTWSTLILERRIFPWGNSWSKSPQGQKHGFSLCYLLGSTLEGEISLCLWAPFSPALYHAWGLLCLNPRTLWFQRWAGTWSPSQKGSVQPCGNQDLVWWNGWIWCRGGGWQGARGMLPSWHWRAASFRGELAPIGNKPQLN